MTDLVQKLVGALEDCISTLTHERLGQWQYMEGDQIYSDFHQAANKARAALSEAKAGGWQPIETAPKDGTEMLLLFGNAEYIFGKTHGRVRAACWTGSGASANWSLPYFKDNPPTAWQPLPAPPAQRGEG